MTIDQIRAAHFARPFRPFAMHLADGRVLQIRHPEFLSYFTSGRTVFVVTGNASLERVDALLIVSLEELNETAA
jgi:hypothetical protein